MKRHRFGQDEIISLYHKSRSVEVWNRFISISKTLGFQIRVTGGNFLTHEINGTKEEFEVIKELLI